MMDPVQEKFDQALADLLPIASGLSSDGGQATYRLLLAVSGGVDSIVMAELFLHSRWHLPFELAHCNFQLRGGDSWSDELFVANWCAEHHIKLNRITFETTRYAEEKGMSIEMAARELRYNWFDQLCTQGNFSAVAIAHNANDNAETLFLNLLRGTGIKGICGMHRKSVLPVPGSHNQLIRPLLSITRAEIETYAQEHGMMYCVDCTNAETEFKRNRIRHLIFPQLEQINPSFLTTLAEDMQRFSQVDEVADAYFQEHRGELVTESTGKEILEIDIEALRHSGPESLAEYMLYRILEPYGFNTATLHDILGLISSQSTVSGKVFHSNGYKLLTTSDKLILIDNQTVNDGNGCGSSPLDHALEKVINNEIEIVDNFSEEQSRASEETQDEYIIVDGEGAYDFNGRRFHVLLMDKTPDLRLRQPEGVVLWDYHRLPFPFRLRTWQNGDWFRPLGLHGAKKLSDLFTDLKFNLLQKQQAVVATPVDGTSHVSSVLCLRIDEELKVTSETTRILIIKEEIL